MNEICQNDIDFLSIIIILKKTRRNNVKFFPIEITPEKFVKMTCKFVDIFFYILIYKGRRSRFYVVCPLGQYKKVLLLRKNQIVVYTSLEKKKEEEANVELGIEKAFTILHWSWKENIVINKAPGLNSINF